MKAFITPAYTFAPGASGVGTVDLSGIAGFDSKLLVAIINQTRGIVIYSTANAALKYTDVTGTVVTLFADTTGQNAADELQVIYQDNSIVQPVSGTVTATGPLTDTELRATPVPVSGIVVSTGLTDAQLRATPVPVSGTVTATGPLTDTQLRATPVPVSGSVTATGPLTDTELRASAISSKIVDAAGVNQLSVGTAGNILVSGLSAVGAIPSLNPVSVSGVDGGGLKRALLTDTAGRAEVTGPLTDTQLRATPISTLISDLFITGQAAQTAIVNNILSTVAGAAATDLLGYKSAMVQISSTGTAGTFIFEGSNDNVNFVLVPVFNQGVSSGTFINAAITATNSQNGYTFPIQFRYYRVRIATTITGGSIQAISRFTQAAWNPNFTQVAQGVATSLNTNVSGSLTTVSTVTTVASVTSSQSAIPGSITDVASAALTTTTTTGTLTPTFGASYLVSIPVTVVSGTNPTLDVQIQESSDGGTNWIGVYDFARITATGFYRSPAMPFTGNRIRYVQTVGGTTPSFTRSVQRLQMSLTSSDVYRQLISRTIDLNTLNSTTASLPSNGANQAFLSVSLGAVATSAPSVQLEGSDDNGTTWYALGVPLLGVASSTVTLVVSNTTSQFLRARVSTAGIGATINYVLVRGFTV